MKQRYFGKLVTRARKIYFKTVCLLDSKLKINQDDLIVSLTYIFTMNIIINSKLYKFQLLL